MNNIEEALQSIRTVESDGNYTRQQRVRVGGSEDTKVGAYGILESKWQRLAEVQGYAGANWRDPRAQDSIVRAKLQRDYEELGSWTMAALAFRYGTQAARALSNAGYIEPKDIEDAGQVKMGEYMRSLRDVTPATNMRVEGQLELPARSAAKNASPANKRAEDIVRQQLRALHNAQKRNPSPIGDTEMEGEAPIEEAPTEEVPA